MNKEKQIQIPETLFTQMIAYILMDETMRTPEQYKVIEKGIYDKIDRMHDHVLYTRSKTAPTEKEKEEARKEYLDKKGIHPNFRY